MRPNILYAPRQTKFMRPSSKVQNKLHEIGPFYFLLKYGIYSGFSFELCFLTLYKFNVDAFHISMMYNQRNFIWREKGKNSQCMFQRSNYIRGISEIKSYYFYNKVRVCVFRQGLKLSILTIEVPLHQYLF